MYRKKFFLKMFLVSFAVIALLPFIPVKFMQSSPTVGRLSVSFANGHFLNLDTGELENLIATANFLIGDTDISAHGNDIPTTRFWATKEAHDVFQDAIDTAETVLREINEEKNFTGRLMPGDVFHMVLRLEDNPGFETMSTRVTVPTGLELTHILNLDFDMPLTFPSGHAHSPETGELTPHMTGLRNAFVICMGGGTLFTVKNANLLVYTFRVSENTIAGETEPIRFAFAGSTGLSPPRDETGRTVNIELPGNNGILGSITVLPKE